MIILAPDGESVLGIVKENNEMYAGFIYNSGIGKDFVIEYDDNFTFEENFDCLIETINEEWQDLHQHLLI